jgi:hypothetical protein
MQGSRKAALFFVAFFIVCCAGDTQHARFILYAGSVRAWHHRGARNVGEDALKLLCRHSVARTIC